MSAHDAHDPKLNQGNWSHWAVTHPSLVLFLILAVFAGGVFSYLRLGRAEDPSFTIKVVVITAAWPGASAREMQDQIAERIEKRLQELAYFDKIETYTKPGFTAMQMVFKDSTPAREVPNLFYQTRKKLDDLRRELPAGVIGPNVNDEYGDVDSILYTLVSDNNDYAAMKREAELLRQRLLRVPNVTKVNLYGTQDERIFVEFSHAKLATLGVPASAIFDSLAKQNIVAPAGSIDTGAQRVPLRVTGALNGIAAVAETPVEAGGHTFRLGDIATITHGYLDPPTFLVRQESRAALAIGVVMQKGANIVTLGHDIEAAKASYLRDLPTGFEFKQIADQPHVVEQAVGEFAESFLEALAIVLFVSLISLGWRTGIVVALSVPLVLAIVFMTMYALSIDLHRISLGALIIALGLLVDDAIIAVEMMVVKMEQGWDRLAAASFAWTSTAFPMLTGTLVTAIGFLPVGLAQSGVGEYAGGIFWVVGIALIASWFVAVIFTPYLGVLLLPDFARLGKVHADPHALYETPLYRRFRAVVRFAVTHRWLVIIATLAILVVSVLAFGRIQQQFFPISERPELFFQIRLPQGTAISSSDKAAREAEKLLEGDKDIATYTTYIGQGSPRFWLGLNPQLPDESFAEIVIVAKDLVARERIKARLEKSIANGALTQARVRVDRFNFGPPVGFPVQFRVVGPDIAKLRDIAYQLRSVMRANPDIIDAHLNWNERQPSVRLVVDQERARAFGLNVQDVAQTLQTLLTGVTVTTVRDRTVQVDVVARAVAAERLDLGSIGDLTITSRNGIAIPLAQVARVEYGQEEPIIWRRSRELVMTVRGDVRDGIQPPAASAAVKARLGDIIAALPEGYRIDEGGAVEESEKGNASIFVLFPIMIGAMLTILMLQVQSFPRLILVFSTAPLGIIGASLALNVANAPFGFVALLGLIALAGIIMRNTVILVDQIEDDVANGSTRHEAIIEATVRRSRPVILTAFAAILAMVPLTTSLFWGPMALTMMGGLFAATLLTLIFLPALYAATFRVRPGEAAKPTEAASASPQLALLPEAAE